VSFNRRAVETGIGCWGYNLAVAARDGVYFVGRDGVYRTDGGTPVPVSGAIAGFFDGTAANIEHYNGSTFDHIDAKLYGDVAFSDELLYVALPTNDGNATVLVLNTRSGDWMMWTVDGTRAMAVVPTTNGGPLVIFSGNLFGGALGAGIRSYVESVNVDDGSAAINAAYETRGVVIADGRTIRVRDIALLGSGQVSVGWRQDLKDPSMGLNAVDLGTIYEARPVKRAWRCARGSLRLSGSSAFEVVEARLLLAGASHRHRLEGGSSD
jgi:hypothetical protein